MCHRPMRVWREGRMVTEMGRDERMALGRGVSLLLICGRILCPIHSCSHSHNELMTCSWAIRGSWWRPGSQSFKMTVPGVSPSWSEGYKAEYVAIHSQRSKRAACDNVQGGDSMQTTTRSKTWLSSARCLVRGCGGGGSRKILRVDVICQHAVTLGLRCALVLLTKIT